MHLQHSFKYNVKYIKQKYQHQQNKEKPAGIKYFCENSIKLDTPNQSLKRDNSVRSPQESDQPHKKLEMENGTN